MQNTIECYGRIFLLRYDRQERYWYAFEPATGHSEAEAPTRDLLILYLGLNLAVRSR